MEETNSIEGTPERIEWSGEFQEVSESTWRIPLVGVLVFLGIAIGYIVWRRRQRSKP